MNRSSQPRDHRNGADVLPVGWILVKGGLFAVLAMMSSALILASDPRSITLFLLVTALWSTARAYYFAFYVIEKYVDGEFRFSGLFDFVVYLSRRMSEHLKWSIWSRWPQWMPPEIQRRIFELSPYRCQQIGQGEPMIVMRREAWEAGAYEPVSGAGVNIQGEHWILREWMREHPGWRP